VIWNHGGAPSAGGKNRSKEWGRALAAAGYIVIHPAHVPVGGVALFQAQCDAEGLAEEPQKQGKPLLGSLAGYRSLRIESTPERQSPFESHRQRRWLTR
jgi:hypothetical protein